jgi:hypothetical protein
MFYSVRNPIAESPHPLRAASLPKKALIAAVAVLASVTFTAVVIAQSPPTKPSYTTRQSVDDRAATFRARGVDITGTANPTKLTPVPVPTGHVRGRPAGNGFLMDSDVTDLPARVFLGRNAWREQRGNSILTFFAGVSGTDGTQGMVVLLAQDATTLRTLPQGGSWIAPGNGGAIHVVDAKGEMIHLVAADGTDSFFDATLRTFVDAQGTPIPVPPSVPTVGTTPPPAITPQPTQTPLSETATSEAVPTNEFDRPLEEPAITPSACVAASSWVAITVARPAT